VGEQEYCRGGVSLLSCFAVRVYVCTVDDGACVRQLRPSALDFEVLLATLRV
jgi:hypothetical protein